MLDDLPPEHRQIAHLPLIHPDHRRTGQLRAAPSAGPRFASTPVMGVRDRLHREPGLPLRPARARPDAVRNDRGAGLANPSELGGLPELLDDIANRAASSSIRTNTAANCWLNRAFSARTCSYSTCGTISC